MSILYAANNKEGSLNLFEKRSIYNAHMDNSNYVNLVDFNFGERYLYGRVNRYFVPIRVNSTYLQTKKFQSVADPRASLTAVNFVVDAFEQMARQFEKCAQLGKISNNDEFLTNLRVHKAYQDPTILYRSHSQSYADALKSIFRNKNINVRNFDEFVGELLVILGATAKRNSFTQTGFMKSKACPINASGLAIEIANLDASNDDIKVNQFVQSLNWDFYVNTCNSYGFMIDRMVPWRIVADVGSHPHKSAIFDYAENYGFNTTNDIIFKGYVPIYFEYYGRFKNQMLSLYNSIKKTFSVLHECDGSVLTERVTPLSYTLEDLEELYTEADFLRMYLQIRFAEEESHFSKDAQSLIIDDSLEVLATRGINASLNIFERILNKTFDYNGSLSYIRKGITLIKEEEFQTETQATGY